MPSDAHTHPFVTESRLTELEIKLSFMEDLLDDLNAIVVQQREQIDRLNAAVTQLRQQEPVSSVGGSALQRAIDNLPPHY